jgi:hypothetical protein
MNATKQIMDILSACGCKPATTVDNNGNATIKVNAPAADRKQENENGGKKNGKN